MVLAVSGGPEWLGVLAMQSWAEALAAVGTTAAFLIAVGVFWLQQRDRRDDEKAQARLVVREVKDRRMIEETWNVSFQITNHSTAPVFRVKHTGTTTSGFFSRFPEGWGPLPDMVVLAPGASYQIATVGMPWPPEIAANQVHPPAAEVEFQFTDARGRMWRRFGTDEPVRVRKPGFLRQQWRSDVNWMRSRLGGK